MDRWLRLRVTITEQHKLFGLTVVIGGLCGLAAVAFHLTINLVSRLAIDPALAAPGCSWIPWTLMVPTLGGLVSGLILERIVPNARGSGVPQVKVAYASRSGPLRARDSLGKFVVSALRIGTGSSLGREGPTVQICAGIASRVGQLAGVSPQNVRRLLPVGAAAGIAAAFNACGCRKPVWVLEAAACSGVTSTTTRLRSRRPVPCSQSGAPHMGVREQMGGRPPSPPSPRYAAARS